MPDINFFKEGSTIDLRSLQNRKKWLRLVAKQYGYTIENLNYIFCSDAYLLKMNLAYLNHNTLTDIITFDHQSEPTKIIEGDVFISTERVMENANQHGVDYHHELSRVMAHGLLHLFGFKDKTEAAHKKMRAAENEALNLLV